jgi:galactokinase/mevalonate kinase-like predicted kinase
VKALAKAADDCWNAILSRDLDAFASAYKASFEAQVSMFPGMVFPSVERRAERIQEFIDRWSKVPGVMAWKMPGAGGGGYLACVVTDSDQFCKEHEEAFKLTIRRPGM